MDKGKNLELNSGNKGEPVKVVKSEGGDMRPARLSGYYSGRGIQNRLKRRETAFREASKERVTVFDSRANKGMDYRGKDGGEDRYI